MSFVFFRFLELMNDWLVTGRFPREEFRVRRTFLLVLCAALAGLAVLTLLAWLLTIP